MKPSKANMVLSTILPKGSACAAMPAGCGCCLSKTTAPARIERWAAGREALVTAIKAGEKIAADLRRNRPIALTDDAPEVEITGFKAFSKQWYDANCKRWEVFTTQRYEEILRLHIWPAEIFRKPIDKISRKEIKQHLRGVYKKRSPATVEAVHGVISGIFEEAIDDEIVDANPARGLLKKILPPKNQRDEKPPAPFTRHELQLFCRAVAANLFLGRAPYFDRDGLCRLAIGRGTGHAVIQPGCRQNGLPRRGKLQTEAL